MNKKSDKVQAILDTSLKLFSMYGFHGTPTAKIAKEAGVGTGTLFHHFKTKEDLINKLFLKIKEDLHVSMSEGIETEDTLKGKIRKVFLNTISWGFYNPSKFNFFNQFRNSTYISQITYEEATGHLNFFYDIYKQGKKEKILKEMPRDLFLDITAGVLRGITANFARNPEKFKDPKAIETAFDYFWDCIKN